VIKAREERTTPPRHESEARRKSLPRAETPGRCFRVATMPSQLSLDTNRSRTPFFTTRHETRCGLRDSKVGTILGLTQIGCLTPFPEAGTVRPVIDSTYPLSKVPEAIRYLRDGRARGKIVITV
jgi:NADPH:quinone reductase-like Zn-dependent oxidoreductase